MKINYGKNLTESEISVINSISLNCGILFDTAKLLYCRNIDTIEKAKAFLNPGKNGFIDPFLFKNMASAVERIKLAKINNENVVIFGDYDADGVCATTVLRNCLLEYGIDAKTLIPEREDGYGINLEILNKIEQNNHIDLLITVDCGISERDNVELLKNNGTNVIITDHHEPPENLPDTLLIDPKIKDSGYTFDGLCGAGVAYKLGYALIGKKADKYLDYVALATVADNMDLIGENRDIVIEGLKIFNSNMKTPFKYLLSNVGKKINSQTLAFQIAPRINAGGRMGDANSALELFNTTDENRIFELGVKLNEYNIARQNECDQIYKEAKKIITHNGLENDPIILVANDSWKAGFIGIVASKLVEDYSRPVIVFAGLDDKFKGSARSVEGVNILSLITECKDLLSVFGGHSQAAGITVEKVKFEALRQKLCELLVSKADVFHAEKEIAVDMVIKEPVSIRFAKEIDSLEPFGIGNKKPLFMVDEDGEIDSKPLKENSPHFSFKTDFIDMLDFNGAKNVFSLSLPIKKQILFETSYSEFKGNESVKGFVKDIICDYGDFSILKSYIVENEISKLSQNNKQEITSIKKKSVEIESGYGTIYAISDIKNLKEYSNENNLPIELFSPKDNAKRNCIVVSLKDIGEGYKKVVYLDNPLTIPNFYLPVYVVEDLSGTNEFNGISLDRSSFEVAFNCLNNWANKPFISLENIYEHSEIEQEENQFILCSKVFFELGFFKNKNGKLNRDYSTKSPLTNSVIYCKIGKKLGCL